MNLQWHRSRNLSFSLFVFMLFISKHFHIQTLPGVSSLLLLYYLLQSDFDPKQIPLLDTSSLLGSSPLNLYYLNRVFLQLFHVWLLHLTSAIAAKTLPLYSWHTTRLSGFEISPRLPQLGGAQFALSASLHNPQFCNRFLVEFPVTAAKSPFLAWSQPGFLYRFQLLAGARCSSLLSHVQ